MDQYQQLFASLRQKRELAFSRKHETLPLPIALDPVRAFASYPSRSSQPRKISKEVEVPEVVKNARSPLWAELQRHLPYEAWAKFKTTVLSKHHLN